MSDDQSEEMPELATNEEWRKIMVRARKEHGLTQTQLGEKVGLTQVMISMLESGERAGSTYVLRICRVLSIPEPMHFASEAQREWNQLGHVLRHGSPEQYEAAKRLVESMVKQIQGEPATPEITEQTLRRK